MQNTSDVVHIMLVIVKFTVHSFFMSIPALISVFCTSNPALISVIFCSVLHLLPRAIKWHSSAIFSPKMKY